MDHFEYLMVMVSIILGLGTTQTLRGLSKMARSPTRFLPATLWVIGLYCRRAEFDLGQTQK